ncbi:MAG: hypothetical protein HRT47_08180 [Candidatus Caenarcaniphilales bacterium]|nr:hypothetical protein [Candidatus Caenarcaniphilales bacterium]
MGEDKVISIFNKNTQNIKRGQVSTPNNVDNADSLASSKKSHSNKGPNAQTDLTQITLKNEYNPTNLDQFKYILNQAYDNLLTLQSQKINTLPNISYQSKNDRDFLENHGKIAWFNDEQDGSLKPAVRNAKHIAKALATASTYQDEYSWLSKLAEVTDLSLSVNNQNELTWIINEGDPKSESVTKRLKRLINSYNSNFNVKGNEYDNYINQYVTKPLLNFIPDKRTLRLPNNENTYSNKLSSNNMISHLEILKPVPNKKHPLYGKLGKFGLDAFKFKTEDPASKNGTVSIKDKELASLYMYFKYGKIIISDTQTKNNGFIVPNKVELKQYGLPA